MMSAFFFPSNCDCLPIVTVPPCVTVYSLPFAERVPIVACRGALSPAPMPLEAVVKGAKSGAVLSAADGLLPLAGASWISLLEWPCIVPELCRHMLHSSQKTLIFLQSLHCLVAVFASHTSHSGVSSLFSPFMLASSLASSFSQVVTTLAATSTLSLGMISLAREVEDVDVERQPRSFVGLDDVVVDGSPLGADGVNNVDDALAADGAGKVDGVVRGDDADGAGDSDDVSCTAGMSSTRNVVQPVDVRRLQLLSSSLAESLDFGAGSFLSGANVGPLSASSLGLTLSNPLKPIGPEVDGGLLDAVLAGDVDEALPSDRPGMADGVVDVGDPDDAGGSDDVGCTAGVSSARNVIQPVGVCRLQLFNQRPSFCTLKIGGGVPTIFTLLSLLSSWS